MKITAPINRVEDIAPMAAAGADEFYCSVLPPDWVESFNTSAISRRAFGNLPEFEDLERSVEIAHNLDKRINLVVNAQHYTEAQSAALIELASAFNDMSGDALIVGDPTLLHQLADKGYDLSLHLSSIASSRNREAAEFFAELGADRIIFPRDMSVKEMAAVSGDLPELEFEAFILNDGCAFDEGSCHTIHLPGSLGGPICIDSYTTDYRSIDSTAITTAEAALIQQNESLYKQWLWYRFSCGFTVTEDGYPYGPCGLCAIPMLMASGVTSIKIAGRDSPVERKVKSVEMVCQVRDIYRDTASEDGAIAHAMAIRKTPQHCEKGYMCYYPESRPGKSRTRSGGRDSIESVSVD